MRRYEVQSTNIQSVGYDMPSHTLEIQFHSGGLYHYYQVPDWIFSSLLKSGSKGRFFHRVIRNRFEYRKVDEWGGEGGGAGI